MKSLLWIVLFELTTCGSYPQISARCTATDKLPSASADPPSVLAALSVSLADIRENHSAVALNISWAINIDNSNKYLIGTLLIVAQKKFLCDYQPPFDEVNTDGYEQLWFHYTEIQAEPNTWCDVIGYNLPTPMDGPDQTSSLFPVPGCSNEIMRQHKSCLSMEWEPNITSIFVNGRVEVSFISSENSREYDLLLWRCASVKECKNSDMLISEVKSFTEGKSKWTRTLNATGPCHSLHILIMPYFPNCRGLCTGKFAPVDCKQREPPNLAVLLCVISSIVVLVTLAVLTWYKSYKTHAEFTEKTRGTPLVSVLVVYPAGNRAFQRAVVEFAELLQSQWHCMVAIDVWERVKMAEQGPVRWLTTQIECVDKVIIVCKQGAESWERAGRHDQLKSLRDHTVPASAEDVFSLALNMLEGRMQGPSTLRKYCTVHLGDRPEAKYLPAALRVCRSFSLMKDMEKLRRHLHNTGPEACCFRSLGLKPGSCNGNVTGKLGDAIRLLQTEGHLRSH